ncbi:MAG: rRNA maturation RNase YbeY [Pseudomonadota bacterium]
MIELDMRIDEAGWTQAISDLEGVCLKALNAGAEVGQISGEISLLFTNDDAIQVLNRDWRGKDKPTDVLSFPAEEMDRPFLGDIAVSLETCQRDADEKSIPLDQHLSHMLIHGYLHLIGHDHMEDPEAVKMETLEVTALASLGWPDPYR